MDNSLLTGDCSGKRDERFQESSNLWPTFSLDFMSFQGLVTILSIGDLAQKRKDNHRDYDLLTLEPLWPCRTQPINIS